MYEKERAKADVLIEAIPYMRKFAGSIVVVKYGGSAMVDERLKKSVIKDIALLKYIGFKPVVIHGGGKEITSLLDRLGKADQEVARRIYDVDVDLKNILNLIRYGFYHKASSETVEGIFISHGSLYALLEKKMKGGPISFSDARQTVSGKYPEVGEMMQEMEAKDEMSGRATELAYDTLRIENYLARRRRNAYGRILSGDPFTIGTILSYIHLCTSTDNTIKGILEAKYYGWDEERIRRELN